MNVISVITDPEEIRKILRHLVKIGRDGTPLRRQAGHQLGWAPLHVIANVSLLRIPGVHFVPVAPTAYSHRPVS